MDLLSLVVGVAILGFVVWLVVTYIPMPAPISRALVVMVVILLVVWLVRILFGPILIAPVR